MLTWERGNPRRSIAVGLPLGEKYFANPDLALVLLSVHIVVY